MKKQIRKSVFETNSSSTHSICIGIETNYQLPEELHFELNYFGGGQRLLYSNREKASYVYTGMCDNNRFNDIDNMFDLLKKLNITITHSPAEYEERVYSDGTFEKRLINGGIDHSNGVNLFLNDICSNEEHLLMFLFSPFSYILTGSDGNHKYIELPEIVELNPTVKHIEYLKDS